MHYEWTGFPGIQCLWTGIRALIVWDSRPSPIIWHRGRDIRVYKLCGRESLWYLLLHFRDLRPNCKYTVYLYLSYLYYHLDANSVPLPDVFCVFLRPICDYIAYTHIPIRLSCLDAASESYSVISEGILRPNIQYTVYNCIFSYFPLLDANPLLGNTEARWDLRPSM